MSIKTNKTTLVNKRKSTNSKIFLMMSILVSIIVSVMFTLLFSDWYFAKQELILSSPQAILFIHDKISLGFIIFSPMVLTFLSMQKLFKKDIMTIFGCGLCSIGIVITILVTVFVLLIQFFNYSIIQESYITVKGGLGEVKRNYSWDEVKKVDVTYHYGTKNRINVDYILTLVDEKQINAYYSDKFFDNIDKVNKLIKVKNVSVNRSVISKEVYNDLYNEYKGIGRTTNKDRFEVVIGLFNEKS